jgi:hypothetical protein
MVSELKFYSQAKPLWRRFRRLMLYTSPWFLLLVRDVIVHGQGLRTHLLSDYLAQRSSSLGINFRLSPADNPLQVWIEALPERMNLTEATRVP